MLSPDARFDCQITPNSKDGGNSKERTGKGRKMEGKEEVIRYLHFWSKWPGNVQVK